jgi:uncharacterized protein (UPF0332 family)
VTELDRSFIRKARESIDGARAEYANERFNNSVNRSYYSCFQAAIYALQMAGFQAHRGEWGHEFVQAQFNGLLINRRHVYSASLRSVLLDNFQLRVRGDYERRLVDRVGAARALQRAERFIGAIVQRQQERS